MLAMCRELFRLQTGAKTRSYGTHRLARFVRALSEPDGRDGKNHIAISYSLVDKCTRYRRYITYIMVAVGASYDMMKKALEIAAFNVPLFTGFAARTSSGL